MRILLARHGETPWNAEGRYQGQEDIPLSPVGEKQARLLGERLRDVRIDRAGNVRWADHPVYLGDDLVERLLAE